MPLLDIRQLTILRQNTTILDRIDWRVDSAQNWVIIGPNGCGKTSLLRALTGYFTPTSGDIHLLGKTYGENDWRELRLRVGIVTSALQTGIPGNEPVLETIISGKYAQLDLWMKTTPADRRAAKKLLNFIGLPKFATRIWNHLSQGERQRVLIARALMANPALLILDEPCSGLDPVARAHFLDFIETLARHKNAPALILVTHHVEEITPAFTHALLLKSGQKLAAGPIAKTLTTLNLSRLFGQAARITRRQNTYALSLKK